MHIKNLDRKQLENATIYANYIYDLKKKNKIIQI